MSNKAIFLDRDGTINVDKGFVYKVEDFEFLPGATEGLKILHEAGFLLIIITNQSGIARGYYTEEDFESLNSWMLTELEKHGVHITAVYYCPHLPREEGEESIPSELKQYRINCLCRKPKLELFERAIKDFNIDLSQSFAIGDKPRDCAICEVTNCRGFLITKNMQKDKQTASSLLDAAKKIIKVI